MKKTLLMLLSIIMTALLVVGCAGNNQGSETTETNETETTTETTDEVDVDGGQDTEFRVAISLPPADNAWQAKMRQDLIEATDLIPDIEFVIVNAVDDNDQLNQLNVFRNDDFDMIMALPGNGTLLTNILEDIYNSGTKTVIFDRAIDGEDFTAFVAGDNYGGGVLAGHFFGEKLNGEGDIVVMRSIMGIPIDLERYNGFMDTINEYYPGINVLVEVDGSFSREVGLEAMTTVLPAFPHIDAVFTQDDEAALGAMNAIQNANRTDIQFITGFGGTQTVFELYEANDPFFLGTASYFPSMGVDAVEIAVRILRGESFDKFTTIPSVWVNADNVSEWMAHAY